MTLLLASVTGSDEAEIALAHGADIVDVPAELAVIRATVLAVGGRKPVSAAIGEVPMQPGAILSAATVMADAGADYVRVRLSEAEGHQDCIPSLAGLARRIKLIGVMFADVGADSALVPLMAKSGFAGAMLATRNDWGHLLDHIDIAALGGMVESIRSRGMIAGLAGSLEAPDIPRLLLLAPDILGVDAAAVDVVRALIPEDPRRRAQDRPAKVDHRLLTARGHDACKDEPTDGIFVHDFVLPVRIGSYAHERDKPQNVRFNVDVQVLRPEHAPADMRDVFSYDLITDSIRMIAVREHIALVEMLAERVAALVLAHPRVMSVIVRVEKLDVGPGSVGVEIVRERPAEPAKVHQLFPLAAETDPKAAR